MITNLSRAKIKSQSAINLNRGSEIKNNNFSTSNSISSREYALKRKAATQIKLPKILNRNKSELNIYKDESFQKLYAKFKKHYKSRFKLLSSIPEINKKNEKDKYKDILNNLYKNNQIDLNKKVQKPKLSEKDLKNFEPKNYQINLLDQNHDSLKLSTVLHLKNQYIKFNGRFNGKNYNLLNRWVNLALKVEGTIPSHLLDKFFEAGDEKNKDDYLW